MVVELVLLELVRLAYAPLVFWVLDEGTQDSAECISVPLCISDLQLIQSGTRPSSPVASRLPRPTNSFPDSAEGHTCKCLTQACGDAVSCNCGQLGRSAQSLWAKSNWRHLQWNSGATKRQLETAG
jgi:hypothetical protein